MFFMQIRNQAILSSFLLLICHLQLMFVMKIRIQAIINSFLLFTCIL